MKEAGIENIIRWLPFKINKSILSNILTNKMIRPTTIPETLDELIIEHAVAREALRLGFNHHKFLARGLRGVRPAGRLDDLFERRVNLETYINMLRVDMIGGTGGLIAHAPRRVQSIMVLIDGFLPEGVTHLVQDSVFMMPHLGVLSTVHPKAALEIFEKDCLVHLGTCIAPRGPILREGEKSLKEDITDMARVRLTTDGTTSTHNLRLGEIIRIPLSTGSFAEVVISPQARYDAGEGPGKVVTKQICGGVVGVILDARGRPLQLPTTEDERIQKIRKWIRAIDMYPKDIDEINLE